MSFTVGQIELDMGTFRFFRSVMHSASIWFMWGSVLGPSHLLMGFAGLSVGLCVGPFGGAYFCWARSLYRSPYPSQTEMV